MKKIKILLVLLSIILFPIYAGAVDTSFYSVRQFVACSNVSGSSPVGISDNFNTSDPFFVIYVKADIANVAVREQIEIEEPNGTKRIIHTETAHEAIKNGETWTNMIFWSFDIASHVAGTYKYRLKLSTDHGASWTTKLEKSLYMQSGGDGTTTTAPGQSYTIGKFATCLDVQSNWPVNETNTVSNQSNYGFFIFCQFSQVCQNMSAKFRVNKPDGTNFNTTAETYSNVSSCFNDQRFWKFIDFQTNPLTGLYTVDLMIDTGSGFQAVQSKMVTVTGTGATTTVPGNSYNISRFLTCTNISNNEPVAPITTIDTSKSGFFAFTEFSQVCVDMMAKMKIIKPNGSIEETSPEMYNIDTGCITNQKFWKFIDSLIVGTYAIELWVDTGSGYCKANTIHMVVTLGGGTTTTPTTTTTIYNGNTWDNVCAQCHNSATTHAVPTHNDCSSCHNGTPGQNNVEPARCTACHGNGCIIISKHSDKNSCLSCHADCTNTTTTIPAGDTGYSDTHLLRYWGENFDNFVAGISFFVNTPVTFDTTVIFARYPISSEKSDYEKLLVIKSANYHIPAGMQIFFTFDFIEVNLYQPYFYIIVKGDWDLPAGSELLINAQLEDNLIEMIEFETKFFRVYKRYQMTKQ